MKSSWASRHKEIMPSCAAPKAFDLQGQLSRHNPKWSGEASYRGYWSMGAPIGNGDFGALIYGAPDNLTLLLGKNDLWLRTTDKSSFPQASYAELYRIYKESDREAYARLLPQDPHFMDTFRPSTAINGGYFRLHLAEAASTDKYSQEISLHDATWRASFQAFGLDNMWPETDLFELDSFVSAPDEVLVFRVRRNRLPLRSFTWRLNREMHQLLPSAVVGGEGALCWLEQEMVKGDRYSLAVLQAGVPVDISFSKRSIIGESVANDDREALFYMAAASHRDSRNPRDLACERVSKAAKKGWNALHELHKKHWAAQWERSWVSCADEKVERPWYISNYLCGTTLRPGKVSPGLQGMWIKENFPAWSADFHGNVNIQAVYQGLMGSNRMEYFEPYARLYHEMLPQCQKDTREYFGIKGARFPHAGAIDGHELCEPNWPCLAISLGPSAWIARLYWWAYLYMMDHEFLAEVAYPILKEVALYYGGLLEISGKGPDGRYRVEPSIFGESNATTFEGWGTDSIYDVTNMRMAFQQAADAAERLNHDRDLVRTWREIFRELPELPADGNGIWLYFAQHPLNGRVTAGSWCYPIFPAEVASLFHGSAVERRRAQSTWNYARSKTNGPWCGGCPTMAASMMGDTEWALKSASEFSNSGLSSGPAGSIMQAEHGTGMSLALNSMVLLGVEGTIILFAGMPSTVDTAFHSLRAPGAVLVSAEQRGGKVVHAAFQALHGGSLRVLNPYDPILLKIPLARVRIRRMDTHAVVAAVDCQWRDPVEWVAEPGAVYLMELDGSHLPVQ